VLLQFAELGFIQGIISKQVLDECRKNLADKLPHAVLPFEKIVERCVTIRPLPSRSSLALVYKQAQEKDLGILASALQADVSFLVTFNVKDYWPSVESLEVITPKELLARIRSALASLVDG
jgi:hypothetical protein